MSDPQATAPGEGDAPHRRTFLGTSASIVMGGGLAAGYGTLAVMGGRLLYPPAGQSDVAWQFVVTVDQLPQGGSLEYVSPSGTQVVLARQGSGTAAEDFAALSNVCPHLGCQVHWEPQNERFFCPCHNGAFDAEGRATEGPPATAGQSLSRFPVMVKDGLVYVEVPIHSLDGPQERLAVADTARPPSVISGKQTKEA